ncbi:hypothetical protein [Mariprofundus erugo]|uniref:hypothetical protein n=1 Tax=Mariprofundus erugo TaxID=2528639 RepID=UPI001EE7B47E|nr:hypothetical protein [Mariprofundus erugo]
MKKLFALLMLLPLFFTACSYEAADQGGADQLVNRYHEAYKTGDWETLLACYDESFFQTHSRNAWQSTLTALTERFGPIREFHQMYSQKDPRYRGDYYMYGYRILFDHGSATETLTIFQGIEEKKLAIAGHVITPE